MASMRFEEWKEPTVEKFSGREERLSILPTRYPEGEAMEPKFISKSEQKRINILKGEVGAIGFKTAFKATLGFYLAQFIAQTLGVIAFLTTIAIIGVAIYLFAVYGAK